jgi:hypothetical protein
MRINFGKLKIVVRDEFGEKIVNIEGKPRVIKDALKEMDKKFNGE